MRKSNIGEHDHAYYNSGKLSAMECFDRLPRELREALRYCDNNYAAAQLYRERNKPKARRPRQLATIATTLAFLREQDAQIYRATYPEMENT